MIIINTTMINAVYLDQYTIIDESSMINDDFGNFSKPICQLFVPDLPEPNFLNLNIVSAPAIYDFFTSSGYDFEINLKTNDYE